MTSSAIHGDGFELKKSTPTKMKSVIAKISSLNITDAEWKEFANKMQIVNPERVKQYLRESCNKKFLKRFFASPKATRHLRLAAKLGKMDMVKVLLELERTDVNKTDKRGQSALHYATQEGHLEIVSMLLKEKNINTSLCDRDGNTSLHIAAKRGDVHVFFKILRAMPKMDPKSTNNFGETPLDLAADRGHGKIVDMLLEETNEGGTFEDHTSTLLHVGVEYGHENIHKKILPKVEGTLEDLKSTALHAAARNGHADIVEKLLGKIDVNSTTEGTKKCPLHLAVEGKHKRVVDLLLGEPTVNLSLKDNDGNNPLHIAAEKGNEIIFMNLLVKMHEVDVISLNKKGMTALHIAAKFNHANIVTMLLERPHVDPCAKTMTKDKTPLRMASKFGGVDVVQVLLKKNVNPCLGDNHGNTPLHLAAKFGHKDVVERLWGVCNLDMVNKMNNQNETPLFVAAKYGSQDVVEFLLEDPKVNIFICDEHGDSPFHVAVKGGHDNIAETLITYPRGIPINVSNEANLAVLHLCIIRGYETLLNMLLKQSTMDANARDARGNFLIHYAARNGNSSIFQMILNATGMDKEAINSVNDHLETPLHIAVKAGNVDVVDLLVKEPNLKASMQDRDGNLPLHVAAKYDEEEMIEKLWKIGVNLNVKNEDGITALVLAAEEGHEFFVDKLLEDHSDIVLNGAKQDQSEPCENDWGIHSLLLAARNGNATIVDSLLIYDVNVNGTHPSIHSAIQGFKHKTALSEAIEHGREKVVKVLLDAPNIDPNRRNEKGEHPLFIASKHGHIGIIEKLLETKLIDVNVLSNDVTALQIAAKNGKTQVVKILLEKEDIDVHIKDQHGETALFYAARADNKTILKGIYDKRKVNCGSENNAMMPPQLSVNDKNNKGESIIHLAAQNKLLNVLDFLLEVECDDAQSVDVNLKTSTLEGMEKNARSALQIAINKALAEAKVSKAARERSIEATKEAANHATIKAKCYKVVEKLTKFNSISFIQEKEGRNFLQHIFKKREWETFSVVMTSPQVTAYIEALYKDRQASVDAANAILVGAALIAGVTFASWLQPPLGYSTYYHEQFSDSLPAPPIAYPEYVQFDHHPSLQAFWIFNSLSFFSAIATVISGARSVLPDEKLFIKKEVENLQLNLLKTSILLGFSMFFVLLAFATAGVVVLPPSIKFRANIFSTIGIGGSVCFMFLFFFGKSIQKLHSNIKHSKASRKGFFQQ